MSLCISKLTQPNQAPAGNIAPFIRLQDARHTSQVELGTLTTGQFAIFHIERDL